MKEEFVHTDFHKPTLELIDKANQIIGEMSGFTLTLRQLYYQFVSRGWIENTQNGYVKIKKIVNDGRLSKLIDWDAIEDRTRNLESNTHWDSPSEIIENCYYSYRIDKWANQKYHVEVWIEKEALAGVIEGICKRLDVSWFCCRGNPSQSEMYKAGKRLKVSLDKKQTPVILYFGDHDPTGVDMTRDVKERLDLFSGYEIQVDRIALNMDQIKKYELPPNLTKMTDTRAKKYCEKYGDKLSVELDALNPQILITLVEKSVIKYRDDSLWEESIHKEDRERRELWEMSRKLKGLDCD